MTERHDASRAVGAVEHALHNIERHESQVRAWVTLEPDRALEAARAVDAAPAGALRGTVFGVKDIIDTADFPTEYGSPIYAGFRPRADAAAVTMLREAGAVCLGKTVTAEFAGFSPGPTTNPHRATHTPGGSSMGSAAAVAVGMADLTLATQTAGSVIRPASFCGVFGFKPSLGIVPTAGVKQLARSVDTVGWFARDAHVLTDAYRTLTGRDAPVTGGAPPRIAVVRTRHWDRVDPDAQAAFLVAADVAREGGAVVTEREAPPQLRDLERAHGTVVMYETARALAWERQHHGDQLSTVMRDLIDRGSGVAPDDYDAARALTDEWRRRADEVFGDADLLLTPASLGEAPAGLDHTGDPRFAWTWTLLGWPSLSVPGLVGASGLPLGVQLVAREHDDARVLAAGAWLAPLLAPTRSA